uniref:Secreted protein n=1 Tax=Strongyloides venezuelensis TaxID=75913 RepID=A0A0K0G4S2_STRVS
MFLYNCLLFPLTTILFVCLYICYANLYNNSIFESKNTSPVAFDVPHKIFLICTNSGLEPQTPSTIFSVPYSCSIVEHHKSNR